MAVVGHRQLPDAPAATGSQRLTGLVADDGHEPWPEPLRLPQTRQSLPDLDPGLLGRIAGEFDVTADDVGHPKHVRVVPIDERRECRRVSPLGAAQVIILGHGSDAHLGAHDT